MKDFQNILKIYFYLFLGVLGLCCCSNFSIGLWPAGATLSLRCTSFSLQWLLFLWSTGSRERRSVVAAPGLWSTGSVVVLLGLSRSIACGIFLDQGLNPCLLYCQVDSLPLSHQGSPSPPNFWDKYFYAFQSSEKKASSIVLRSTSCTMFEVGGETARFISPP